MLQGRLDKSKALLFLCAVLILTDDEYYYEKYAPIVSSAAFEELKLPDDRLDEFKKLVETKASKLKDGLLEVDFDLLDPSVKKQIQELSVIYNKFNVLSPRFKTGALQVIIYINN